MTHSAPIDSSIKPRYLRIRDAVRYSGLSRSELYRQAAAGRITFRKSGNSTLIDVAALDQHLDTLPTAKIRPAA